MCQFCLSAHPVSNQFFDHLLACRDKVIHKFKRLHAKLLRDCLAIGSLPVWDIRCVHDVIFDFACDSNGSDLGPQVRVSVEFGKELRESGRKIFDTLRWDLSERL